MSGRPPVSMIIPALEAEATLPATLDAILSQDCPGDVEVIVADGSDTAPNADLAARRRSGVIPDPGPDRGIAAGPVDTVYLRAYRRCAMNAGIARVEWPPLSAPAADAGGAQR